MKSEIYLCSCHGEGISIEKWDENEIYLSLWFRGARPRMGFRDRMRYIWQVLTKGYAWADELIITNETAKQLGEYLINITNSETKTSDESNTESITFSKVCSNCGIISSIEDTICPTCGEEK